MPVIMAEVIATIHGDWGKGDICNCENISDRFGVGCCKSSGSDCSLFFVIVVLELTNWLTYKYKNILLFAGCK